MIVGATGNQTQNNGRMFIALKPVGERTASATQIIQRLAPKVAQVQGATLFMQPAQVPALAAPEQPWVQLPAVHAAAVAGQALQAHQALQTASRGS